MFTLAYPDRPSRIPRARRKGQRHGRGSRTRLTSERNTKGAACASPLAIPFA